MEELWDKLVDMAIEANDDFEGDHHPDSAGYVKHFTLQDGRQYTFRLSVFPTEDE